MAATRSTAITGAPARKFYLMPDLSFSAGVDQIHLNHAGHVTEWNVGAEWQVTDRMPLSIFGNYAHSDYSGSSFSFDTLWSVCVGASAKAAGS